MFIGKYNSKYKYFSIKNDLQIDDTLIRIVSSKDIEIILIKFIADYFYVKNQTV